MYKQINAIWVLILSAALMVGAAGLGAPAWSAAGKYKSIFVASADAGGAWYPIGAAIADVITKGGGGTQARAQSTGGAMENVRLVNAGTSDLGITIGYLAYSAYNGASPFKQKMENIRSLFSGLSVGVLQVLVPAKSSIKSMADLKGKKIAAGAAGQGSITVLNDIFKEYGFGFNDIKPNYVTYDEGIAMMTDGHVDAAVAYAGLPTPTVKTLSVGPNAFRMIGIDEKLLNTLLQKYPYYTKVLIPRDMYKLAEDVTTIGTPNMVIVNKSLPDDLVYQVVKAIFVPDNLKKIQESHPSAKGLTLEKAAQAPVPLHPGAEKFYRERGLIK